MYFFFVRVQEHRLYQLDIKPARTNTNQTRQTLTLVISAEFTLKYNMFCFFSGGVMIHGVWKSWKRNVHIRRGVLSHIGPLDARWHNDSFHTSLSISTAGQVDATLQVWACYASATLNVYKRKKHASAVMLKMMVVSEYEDDYSFWPTFLTHPYNIYNYCGKITDFSFEAAYSEANQLSLHISQTISWMRKASRGETSRQ